MALKLSITLTAIAFICLLQPLNGDEAALIGNVCGRTPEPDNCKMCLAKATNEDEKGLAAISLNCSLTISYMVIDDFGDVANTTSDQKIIDVCNSCRRLLGDAVLHLRQAMVDLIAGRFINAAVQVAESYDAPSRCWDLYSQLPGPPMEPVISEHFETLEDCYKNTDAIVYHLEG